MAHDVFISYAAEDKQVAEQVCRALEGDSVRCWMAPRDVPVGEDFEEAIIDAISESPLLVLIHSAHSNDSPHVKREIQNARREGATTRILPLHIDDTPYSKALVYHLGSTQWLDASPPPLESHLRRLIEHVRTHLPRAQEPNAARHPAEEAPPPPVAPPAKVTPPPPVAPGGSPSAETSKPETQAATTANKPAATTEAAPAPTGKHGDGTQPKSVGLSQAGCVFLSLVVFSLIFSSGFCNKGSDSNANSNSVASANTSTNTNANRPPPNANQSGGVTNINATLTPQSSPSPQVSPSPAGSNALAQLPLSDSLIWFDLQFSFRRINGLSEVSVEVKDKKVTLDGFVYSEMCKQTAVRLAKEADGVIAVNANKIAISRKPPEDITKRICLKK